MKKFTRNKPKFFLIYTRDKGLLLPNLHVRYTMVYAVLTLFEYTTNNYRSSSILDLKY